jgi:ATP-dependent helicase/nuclease subunit B
MPQADYRALRSALGEPAGFIPADSVYLDETEWWLQQLRESKKGNDIHLARVRNAYPWLDRGWNAARERSSDRFTVFDGWLKDVEGELDPRQNRQPVSCTQIESLARCPFAYFLRYVLEIEPPEDWARDPTLWLDARTFGSLLHEVFRAFMVDLTGREEKPNFQLHWNLLKLHAEEAIERWRSQLPPPNMAAYTRQQNHVLVTCETFLKNEEAHCREVMPQYFEVPFGLSEDAPAAPMGSRSPVSIDMGEGKDFLLRGCIDRIDWRRDGEYEVWDYKSGSTRAFHQQKPLNRGRQIQHALYARAVEILLARAEKQGRVIRSGYFFPGPRGAGERMALEHDATALKKVIDALFTLLGGGVFPFAPDSDSCGWCDYEVVCGGAKDANVRTTAKLNNPATSNAVLDPLRRLIDCDD